MFTDSQSSAISIVCLLFYKIELTHIDNSNANGDSHTFDDYSYLHELRVNHGAGGFHVSTENHNFVSTAYDIIKMRIPSLISLPLILLK